VPQCPIAGDATVQISQKEVVIMYVSEIWEFVICTYQKLSIK
jgi:hypothetical protein